MRYNSEQHLKIITTFLGIISIASDRVKAIFQPSSNIWPKDKILFKNCIGLGTDEYNRMCGGNFSVITSSMIKRPNIKGLILGAGFINSKLNQRLLMRIWSDRVRDHVGSDIKTFLGIISIASDTVEAIFQAIVEYLANSKIA